jgi:hypothetical protein
VVVVWTCRDKHHIPELERFLHDNEIKYTSINSSIKYAPFDYEARKIYAHMYVDDRGFGWKEYEYIMIDVMVEFMTKVMDIPNIMVDKISRSIIKMEDINLDEINNYLYGRRVP